MSKRTIALLLMAATALATVAFLGVASASANCINSLSGSIFEIDPDANTAVNATGCLDWEASTVLPTATNGTKATNDITARDEDDAFGQGTAEDDINPTIVTGSIPPNKSDLLRFGVYSESGGATTGKFLELYWTRINSPQGTTNMDFELNKLFCDGTATDPDCADNGPLGPETPKRSAGDKLITYDLSKGGTVPTISIRTWIDEAPTGLGDEDHWSAAVCLAKLGGCPGATDPLALGSVNSSQFTAAADTRIGTRDPFTFGEAAIDYKALFSGNQCGTFGSAYLKSRSSDSFTAEIKDFIVPEQVNISNCTTLTTQASGPVTIGSAIHDTATLSGATANAGGTITFKAFSDSNCSNLVFTSDAIPVSGPGNYTSNDFTPNAVGTYYWTASYSGDVNNAAANTNCGDANESSIVNKAKPSLTTTASGPVTIGSAIHDTATLSGGNSPTGTITFHVYSDDTCSTEVTPQGGLSATVNGNGDYTSGDFTPTKAGTYYWTASYSGDSNNESASTACGDANESSVVGKAASNIATAQELFPQDSVTLSANAGGTPTGNVDFLLYGPNNPTCDPQGAAAVYTESNVALDANGEAKTSNSTFSVSAANSDVYHWKVVYGGDATHDGSTSDCTENFTLTIANG